MKLLYTLTTYPPAIGGAQLHQHLLAQQLQHTHNIQVLTHWNNNRTDWLLGTTLNAPSRSQDYDIDKIPVHQIGISQQDKIKLSPYIPLYYPFMGFALPKIANILETYIRLHAQDKDLIHNVRIGREGLSYASYNTAKKLNIPFIFTPVHHPRWVGWRYREYIKLYGLADAVIALTDTEKQILIQLGVREDRIHTTGHGPILAPKANPGDFRRRYKIDEPIILFLGQHYAYKGYQQLLQATKEVWQKFPEAQFVFIGPPVKNSEKVFSEYNDPRIHRLGSVDLQTKTDALAACTLLCVPSSQESFGGVYTEAWSFAKPVIGCPIPAVAEVITGGVDGHLVPQDSKAISGAICQLLEDTGLARTMGKAGLEKVQRNFTWQRLAAKTEEIYLKTLEAKAL
ncbi:MAG: D-inositol-3-phosphate glycosyltransferase [Chroococcopsis gigantea SAG 12.99]|jgi:glycosyltransferase involved in cell wall biosynthesis|nr:D-inositol-3-phosphate glycosyltransferase [Chroococcopsis gigantea SAG 12.99]